ncbi:MAG TPA: DUF2335 domain-containing protein [Patescibacteria group bacterium]|nr:DUF2335 domain-containing protein [Patescibacteria group bacterium]
MNQSSENQITSSKNNKDQQKNFVKEFHRREVFTGPLPHPDVLKKYEETLKGSANRIIKLTEGQTSHRQALEKKVIGSNVWNERIGMIFSFIITFTVIIGAIYLIRSDKQIGGLISLILALGIQAYNFYTRRKKENQTPHEKK